MKIKLVNLIEGGVNTPAPALASASTPATATSSTKPSAPKEANWSSLDLLKGMAAGAIGFATGNPSAGVKMATSAATTDTKDLIPQAVKQSSSVGSVIGGGLGLLFGGLPGAIAGAAIGSQIPGAVSGYNSSDAASKSKPAKNQEHADRHKDYMERTQRKLERDQLTRQAEIEAESHRARMSRIARSRTRIFEQQNLQFKSGTLKSLLEGGVVSDTLNYFTPTMSPKVAAKRFIDITTPQPGGDSSINFVKSLVGVSPVTYAKLQAKKAASAAAFDPTIGAEKIKHYANIIQATDPINLAGKLARGLGTAAQFELRNRLYYGLGDTRSSPLSKLGLGRLGAAAGAFGGAAGIAAPYTQAKATVAGKIVAAQKDDWRYAALPN